MFKYIINMIANQMKEYSQSNGKRIHNVVDRIEENSIIVKQN